jgi:hypothetical protein
MSIPGLTPLHPWPSDRVPRRPRTVVITYCFATQADKTKLGDKVRWGWDLWHSRLGDAEAYYRHRLGGFYEFTSPNGQKPYCYDAWGGWNWEVPQDTLVVRTEGGLEKGMLLSGIATTNCTFYHPLFC